MKITPIGIIHTPFVKAAGTPVQPSVAKGAEGTVEVFGEYVEGLVDLDGFERIWLLFWLDRASEPNMSVIPYKDNSAHGLFSTRAPSRPNPIGISAVRLLGVDGPVLRIADVDMLDGSPLIDIKPYVSAFDSFPGCRAGWLETASDRSVADDRFFSGNHQ